MGPAGAADGDDGVAGVLELGEVDDVAAEGDAPSGATGRAFGQGREAQGDGVRGSVTVR